MKNYKQKIFRVLMSFVMLSGLVWSNGANAQTSKQLNEADQFPLPPVNKAMLFYLQRTPNTNTIVYALNYDEKNALKETEPVKVYWIRYTEQGTPTKNLNFIEKKFAYGIKTQKSGKDIWNLKMVAYDRLPITLRKGKHGSYTAFVKINNKEYVFQKAYIKIDGGSFWSPNIPYIDIYAKDETTKKEIIHRISNPKNKKNG